MTSRPAMKDSVTPANENRLCPMSMAGALQKKCCAKSYKIKKYRPTTKAMAAAAAASAAVL